MATSEAQCDLLHALGYLHLVHGRADRALTLLRMADGARPGHAGIGRTLAFANLADGRAAETLALVDRLEPSADAADRPVLVLLRCRALLKLRRVDEARRLFPEFIRLRNAESASCLGS